MRESEVARDGAIALPNRFACGYVGVTLCIRVGAGGFRKAVSPLRGAAQKRLHSRSVSWINEPVVAGASVGRTIVARLASFTVTRIRPERKAQSIKPRPWHHDRRNLRRSRRLVGAPSM